MNSDQTKMQPSFPSLLRGLWSHIQGRRRIQYGVLLVAMMCASFAEVVSISAVLPFLGALTDPKRIYNHPYTQPLIHFLGINQPSELLAPLTVAFCIAAMISGAMRLVLLWGQIRLSHATGADFSYEIYRRTLYQPYEIHIARNSSEIITTISTKASLVVYQILIPVLSIISSTMMLIAIAFALVSINPAVALGAFLGFGALYITVISLTKNRLARHSAEINQGQNQVAKALQEGLGGIRDILLNGTQNNFCQHYRNVDMPLRRSEANIQIISSSPRFVIESLGMVLIGGISYLLAGGEGDIVDSIPVLGALALGAQRLLPILQQAYSNWAYMRGGREGLKETIRLLQQPLPYHADSNINQSISFKHNIEIRNIEFRYHGHSPVVLDNLTLLIEKGDRIGIVGSTGSGKSTLVDVLMGLLHPTVGQLYIDGLPITKERTSAWQKHIAHVPQSIFLADATVKENIAFGIPRADIDIDRVKEAADKAQIGQTVETWQQQYDTVVGERGVRLSGGQRQRIGLARALYKRAEVLIFDEATNSLDGETEDEVMDVIYRMKSDITLIIVAHRLSTLKHCTKIIELKNGKIYRIIRSYDEL